MTLDQLITHFYQANVIIYLEFALNNQGKGTKKIKYTTLMSIIIISIIIKQGYKETFLLEKIFIF